MYFTFFCLSQTTESGREQVIADLKAHRGAPDGDELLAAIEVGVAYHNSDLTHVERDILEQAFKNHYIQVICCTSTLAAGTLWRYHDCSGGGERGHLWLRKRARWSERVPNFIADVCL